MPLHLIQPNIKDLNTLEKSKQKFDMLTYDDKITSNDEAIRIYGKNNISIYNIRKAMLLDKQDSSVLYIDDDSINTVFSEAFTNDSETDDNDIFLNKIDRAKKAEEKGFIIICPISIENNYYYSLEELYDKFNRYNLLSIEMQMMSDSESSAIFGNDVKYMYQTNKVKIISNSSDDNLTVINKSNIDDYLDNIDNSDELQHELYNLEMLSIKENGLLSESVIINKYNKTDKKESISSLIPEFSPYLTYDEVCDLLTDEKELIDFKENFFIEDYIDNFKNNYGLIKEMSLEYLSNPNSILEQKLIKFGWNPSVSITPTSLNIGKIKNNNYLKENSVNIIDLTNFIVKESSDVSDLFSNAARSTMDKKDISFTKNDLVPIYIVLLYVGSPFGKAIKAVTRSEYSHAAIGFTPDLNLLYSYSTSSPADGGFKFESLKSYIESGKFNNTPAKIQVLTLFVSTEEKEIINEKLKYYIDNREKSKYDFKNVLRVLINKKISNKDCLNMVCSEFVDFILKTINVDITNKSSNLVTPKDFEKVKHPKVFKLYDGLAEDYDKNRIEISTKALRINRANLFKTVPLKEMVSLLFENRDIILYKSVICTNNEANDILEKINNLIIADSVITESKFPISFKNNGDLNIELPKKMEDEYQKSHTLLLEYDKNSNKEGIKNEICKLWFMNNKIEIKLRSKKDFKNKDEYIKLRARILNDFKKYLSTILKDEKDFNFSEYFNNSKYYDKSISIDQHTIKWTAKSLKSIILSL